MAPRRFWRLTDGGDHPPLGDAVWSDTDRDRPLPAGVWRNVLTGKGVRSEVRAGTPGLMD